MSVPSFVTRTRKAAAVILLGGDPADSEVFLVERSPRLRFLGGYVALPGGVEEPEDGGRLEECARRELFEETGVLLGDQLRAIAPGERERIRRALVENDLAGGGASIAGAWQELAAATAGPVLREVCRLVTPPFAPVVYDTRFFLARLPASESPEIWPGELVSGGFWRPRDALAAWLEGRLRLAPPVLFLLEIMAEHGLERFAEEAGERTRRLLAGELPPARFAPGIVMASQETRTVPPALTTNCYLVGRDRLFVVDPGSPFPAGQSRLVELVENRSARGARVAGILLTHHHPDHVGAAGVLCEHFGVSVDAHELTLARLPAGVPRGRALADNDRLDLGTAPDGRRDWTLRALHTPGHARGHLCFLEDRYDALIAGDMVSTLSTILIDPPEGHLKTYLISLERLLQEPVGTLFPGHGPPAPDGHAAIRRYLRHRGRREQKLLAVLGRAAGTLDDLLPLVYDDVAPALHRFARRSLVAGLEKLGEDGRVETDAGMYRLLA